MQLHFKCVWDDCQRGRLQPTEHLLTEARSPENGKLHAQRLAQTFGLSLRELGQVLKRNASGLSKHPTSDSFQDPVHALETVGVQLRDVFGTLETGRMWLRAPNPVLNNRAPITYLLEGRPAAVQHLLMLAETGTPT